MLGVDSCVSCLPHSATRELTVVTPTVVKNVERASSTPLSRGRLLSAATRQQRIFRHLALMLNVPSHALARGSSHFTPDAVHRTGTNSCTLSSLMHETPFSMAKNAGRWGGAVRCGRMRARGGWALHCACSMQLCDHGHNVHREFQVRGNRNGQLAELLLATSHLHETARCSVGVDDNEKVSVCPPA